MTVLGLDTLSVAEVEQLRRRVGVLQSLHSPRLLPVIDMIEDDERLSWLTAPTPGASLRATLEHGPLPPATCLHIASGLFEALADLHGGGTSHGHVTPDCIYLNGISDHPTVVLGGFGPTGHSHSADGPPVGATRYLAPEQLGALRRAPDHRSDLYSAGVVLFECLTGDVPFAAPNPETFLDQQTTKARPRLADRTGIPDSIDHLLDHLLQLDPNDRYQDAGAVLVDLDRYSVALDAPGAETDLIPGRRDRRRSLCHPGFVGRTRELARLASQCRDAASGSASLTLLVGESGVGKTRLLDEFAARAQASSWVLRGQSMTRVAFRPLTTLSSVIADVISASSSPDLAVSLRASLGQDLAVLAELDHDFAALLGTESVSSPTDSPNGVSTTSAISALVRLLGALGSEDRPAVVLLDDCQWADGLTRGVLEQWSTLANEGGANHTMVVAAFRDHDIDANDPSRRIRGERIQLPRLTRPELRSLAESMAGPLPADVVDVVLDLADGNAFMAVGALHGLVNERALVAGPNGWLFEGDARDASAPETVAGFLSRRIAQLPAQTRSLLAAGAVLGREFDASLASELAGLPGPAVSVHAEAATQAQIIRPLAAAQHYGFTHDKLREALLDDLNASQQRELHQRAAQALQSSSPEAIYDLAYHLDAGGQPERALPYALAAAEKARGQHALEEAEIQYRIALKAEPACTTETLARIAEGYGTVLMLQGKYEEAEAHLHRAAALVDITIDASRIEGNLGEIAFKRGNVEDAVHHHTRALALLGRRVPRRRTSTIVWSAWEILLELASPVRTLIRRWRPRDRNAAVALLASRLHRQLFYVWWFAQSSTPMLWAQLRALHLSEPYPASAEFAHAAATHGAALAAFMPRLGERSLRLNRRALDVREALGDAWGQAQAHGFYAIALHATGRFDTSRRHASDAARRLGVLGDPWEQSTASWHVALCHYREGNLAEASEWARNTYDRCVTIGDTQGSAIALSIWARATTGDIPPELVDLDPDQAAGDIQATVALQEAEALRRLRTGDLLQAGLLLDRAARTLRARRYRNIYVASIMSWRATVHRMIAEGTSRVSTGAGVRDLRRARRSARSARRWSIVYPHERAHALREAGLVAVASGHPKRALRLLRLSLLAARRMSMTQEHALTLTALNGLDRGTIEAGRAGSDPSTMATNDGDMALENRFVTVLEAGRQLASAASVDEVLTEARRITGRLLRADVCGVTVTDDLAAGMASRSVDDGTPIAELLESAVSDRRVLVLTPAPGSSEQVQGIACALCAPVVVRGEVRACIWATHRVPDMFGDHERDLARFVASLAGAAAERELLRREVRAKALEAQEGERARFARDLHDGVGQTLTSVLLGLQDIGEFVGQREDRADVLSRVRDLRTLVADGLRDVRRTAFDLRPLALDDLGLPAAIKRLADKFKSSDGLVVHVDTEAMSQSFRLPAAVETAAYRIAQEALTNAARHSGARTCSVLLARSAESFRLVIDDDGSGMDGTEQDGSGLRGMSERAQLVGGSLSVESNSRTGTTICFEL